MLPLRLRNRMMNTDIAANVPGCKCGVAQQAEAFRLTFRALIGSTSPQCGESVIDGSFIHRLHQHAFASHDDPPQGRRFQCPDAKKIPLRLGIRMRHEESRNAEVNGKPRVVGHDALVRHPAGETQLQTKRRHGFFSSPDAAQSVLLRGNGNFAAFPRLQHGERTSVHYERAPAAPLPTFPPEGRKEIQKKGLVKDGFRDGEEERNFRPFIRAVVGLPVEKTARHEGTVRIPKDLPHLFFKALHQVLETPPFDGAARKFLFENSKSAVPARRL